jgi:hypothetical protein
MIAKAIEMRKNSPYAMSLRWCNFASCLITIPLLFWRNYAKVNWTNHSFRKEVWLEKRTEEPSHFCQVDESEDEDDKADK